MQGKVNPPLRERDHVEALWQRLIDGTVDVLGSDHCPFTKAVKGTDLWSARAGITAGSAMILPVLLTEGVRRGRLTIQRVVELTSSNAARLFGLYPRKGALEVGSDADLVIVDSRPRGEGGSPHAQLRRRLQPVRGLGRARLGRHDDRGRPGRLRRRARSSPTAPAAATSREARAMVKFGLMFRPGHFPLLPHARVHEGGGGRGLRSRLVRRLAPHLARGRPLPGRRRGGQPRCASARSSPTR